MVNLVSPGTKEGQCTIKAASALKNKIEAYLKNIPQEAFIIAASVALGPTY
jgi:hypothetical protein